MVNTTLKMAGIIVRMKFQHGTVNRQVVMILIDVLLHGNF